MSEEDDVKEVKATRFQKILDKLELLDKKIDSLKEKPKQLNKTIVKDSEMYRNKKNVYLNKLNTGEIRFPKKETLEYYEITYNEEAKFYS